MVGPTQALSGHTGGPGLAVPPGPAPGLPGHQERTGWQLAQRAWQESGAHWESIPPGPGYGPGPGSCDSGPDYDCGPGPDCDSGPGLGAGIASDDHGAIWKGGAAGRIVFGSSGASPVAWQPDTAAPDTAAPGMPEPGIPEPETPGPPDAGPAWWPETGWSDYPPGGFPGQSWPSGDAGRPPAHLPAFGAAPLGAPVTEAWQGADRPARAADAAGPPPLPVRTPGTGPAGEPDELFMAWQGSVRQASAPRRAWPALWRGRRSARSRAWQAVTIGVPAAVIVTVGAGALMMLTGRANEMLAVRADTGTGTRAPAAALSPAATVSGGTPAGALVMAAPLPGYPGQRGMVTAGAMRTAAGVTVAVGGADGHPAIWRRAGGGGWVLESAAVLGAVPGTGNLTAVTRGPRGWLAVGSATGGGGTFPLALTSADGVTWQPVASLAGQAVPGTQFTGVAAGPRGYVVVGRQTSHGRTFAVLWWSPDLRAWTAEGNGHLDGRLLPSAVNAVAAAGGGFAGAGSHGTARAAWVSPDGQNWHLRNISAPPGAGSATATVVAAAGTSVVAAGYAATPGGTIPVAAFSGDGGAHWRQVLLPAPGGGTVTALTTAGGGFVAAGLAGPASARQAVIWTSRDGITWSAAIPVSAGAAEITALESAGRTIIASVRQGASSSVRVLRLPRA